MDIFNIEKLDLSKPIVLTGRNEHVRVIAKELKAKLYYLPRCEDHYTDYPAIIVDFQRHLSVTHKDGVVILTTQSAEFLDCLLESNFYFQQVTVRHYNDGAPYRIRVLTKEEALANRELFNMELRV